MMKHTNQDGVQQEYGAMKIIRYDELTGLVSKFAEGHFRLLVIVGPPGNGKSSLVRRRMPDARWVNASLSAFQLYKELWSHKDEDFVIDDVDGLVGDPAMVRLLKALCDSHDPRRICWLTASSRLCAQDNDGAQEDAGDKPPHEFVTRSRLIIIANDWRTLNRHVAAVADRGTVVHFAPSPFLIHTQAQSWFTDGEIHEHIGRHLRLLGRGHSLRWYVKSAEWKGAGLDWRDMLRRSWGLDEDVALVLRLLDDESLTMAERVACFAMKAAGGKSERRFYLIYDRLREAGVVRKPSQTCEKVRKTPSAAAELQGSTDHVCLSANEANKQTVQKPLQFCSNPIRTAEKVPMAPRPPESTPTLTETNAETDRGGGRKTYRTSNHE